MSFAVCQTRHGRKKSNILRSLPSSIVLGWFCLVCKKRSELKVRGDDQSKSKSPVTYVAELTCFDAIVAHCFDTTPYLRVIKPTRILRVYSNGFKTPTSTCKKIGIKYRWNLRMPRKLLFGNIPWFVRIFLLLSHHKWNNLTCWINLSSQGKLHAR